MAQKGKRGFAAMSEEKQREIARKGGKASRGGRSKRGRKKDEGLVEKAEDLIGF